MPPRWSNMRIIAVPLSTKATPTSQALINTILPLTYYHFHTPPPHPDKEPTMFKRATTKVAEVWANFGKAPDKHWKRRIFIYGERLIDRIDFEELSLKSLDPSLGPRIGQLRRDNPEKEPLLLKIPLYYPPSIYAGLGTSPLSHISLLLEKRHPHHKKWFYRWLLIAPFTAPFALIPIVPNLPFFYAAWRAWSHYRAWKASKYMQGLISSQHVEEVPSEALDEAYHTPSIPPPEGTKQDTDHSSKSTDWLPPSDSPHLLLSIDGIPKIIETFKLASSARADIARAVEQARVRLEHL